MKIKLLFIIMFCSLVSWGQATLPVNRTTWNVGAPTGWTDGNLTNPSYNTPTACNTTAGRLDNSAEYYQVFFDSAPDQLSYSIRLTATAATSSLLVEQSPDGLTWSTIINHTGISGTSCSNFNILLLSTTRYVKWTYTKVAQNLVIDDVIISTPPTVVPTITSPTTNVTVTYGTAFPNYTITANQSPTSYIATGLPAGMVFNTTTGLISGTSSQVGTFPVSISAINNIGTSTIVIKNYIINPKPLTIIGLTIANKVYDGTTTATLTGTATLSGGLVGADVVTLSGSPTSNYSTANAGGAYVITTTGYTLSGADAAKYTVSQPSVTSSITKKPLTITGITANNKIYDTTIAATLSGTASLVGIVGADVVTIAGVPVATFATANVGTAIAVTIIGYTITGAQSANYTLTAPTGLTANITQATPIIVFGALPDQALSGSTFTISATSTSPVAITYSSSNPAVATINTTTGVVTMLSVGSTIFTASQIGNANYTAASNVTQNQNIIAGLPQIRLERSTNANIPNGSAPSNGFDTQFAMQTIGNSQTKTYNIRNIGGATLNVSAITLVGVNPGDFSISAGTPFAIAPLNSFVTFTVTFAPTAIGNRIATVRIANDDLTKNPFTFDVQGTGNCPTTTIIATPASGPVATQVTITSTNPVANNLTGATAAFGGIAATVLSSSASQMVVVIPAGAGNTITTTNTLGCTATLSYIIIKEDKTSCEGTSNFSDLIISEVYDSDGLNVWHMELFNPTASAINLATSNYTLKRFGDVGAASPTRTINLTGTVNAGTTFYMNLGDSGTPCAGPYDFTANGFGINSNDEIRLTKNGVDVDVVRCPIDTDPDPGVETVGYSIRRISTTSGPTMTWDNTNWTILLNESCTDLDLFPIVLGNSPIINAQPTANITCDKGSVVLSVTATEGFLGGNTLTYQWYEVAPGASIWTTLTDVGVYSGSLTMSLTISDFSGLNGYQYYCRVRENTATCYSATNAVIINDNVSTTWNGALPWTNGTPTLTKAAIINADYNTLANGNIDACSVTVNATRTLTISPNTYVNIENGLVVNGNVIVQDNGSLVQINDNASNSGNITVEREAVANAQDYIYWSAPVTGQSLATLFPTIPNNLKWRWDATEPNANGTQGYWLQHNAGMTAGVGYIVGNPTASTFTKAFTGAPHNGIYNTVEIKRGSTVGPTTTDRNDNWNLLGNPYPSAISPITFLSLNPQLEGYLLVWKHDFAPSTMQPNPFYQNFVANYNVNDYVSINSLGNNNSGTAIKIASGQGFMVAMDDGAATTSTATFNNSMRSKTYDNSQFFRTASNNTSRIWLDIVSGSANCRTMFGYADQATNGYDNTFDAFTKTGTGIKIYSVLNNDIFAIQGKQLPFQDSDLVPIGIKLPTSGTHTIAIAEVDGLFANGNQTIYLEDKLLNIVHNLSANVYSFSSDAGIFDNRFVIRYTNAALSNANFDVSSNDVLVYKSINSIKIESKSEKIKNYTVYNVLGQVIASENNIDNNNFEIKTIQKNNQALIVKTTLENGQVITKKIIF